MPRDANPASNAAIRAGIALEAAQLHGSGDAHKKADEPAKTRRIVVAQSHGVTHCLNNFGSLTKHKTPLCF